MPLKYFAVNAVNGNMHKLWYGTWRHVVRTLRQSKAGRLKLRAAIVRLKQQRQQAKEMVQRAID